MATERMGRGRTSSLFNYMPEQTFNWEKQKGSFKGNDDVSPAELDMPKGWIKHKLIQLVRPFELALQKENNVSFPATAQIGSEKFDLYEPLRLGSDMFPSTYLCSTCERFSTKREKKCVCGGTVSQFTFVEYHRCGHLSALVSPACPRGHKQMKLAGASGGRSIKNWEWRCAECGLPAKRTTVRYACRKCKQGSVQVARADANAVYRTQSLVTVNPPSKGDYSVFESPVAYDAAIAQALGTLPSDGLTSITAAVNDKGSAGAVEEAKKTLQRMGMTEDSPGYESFLDNLVASEPSLGDWGQSVSDLNLTSEDRDLLGHDCAELALARESNAQSINELLASSVDQLDKLKYAGFQKSVEKYNFSEVLLLRSFPLAYIVAGYTREEMKPGDNVRFNFFKSKNNSRPMYGQRVETEAILFKLDADKVLGWLVGSGVVEDPHVSNAQEWIFSNTASVDRYGTPQDPVNAATLGLVHSVAHRALTAVSARSGLSPESLSEYLFHRNLTFLVYADARGTSSLGGLENMYKNYLAGSLDAMSEAKRCVFDPPCNNDKGACAICMYISETSCQRSNGDLSRHYLFGGEHGGIKWKPFWG